MTYNQRSKSVTVANGKQFCYNH